MRTTLIGSQIGKGAGEIGKGALDHQSQLSQAEASQAEARAKVNANEAQESGELMNHFQEMLRDFLQKIAAINQSTEQSLQSVFRV